MKSKSTVCVFAVLSFLLLLATGVQQANTDKFDLHLRHFELFALKKGYNPFDIWRGEVVVKGHHPLIGNHLHKKMLEGSNYVKYMEAIGEKPHPIGNTHAYTPWQYSLLLPFAWFKFKTMAWFWVGFLYLLTVAGVVVSFLFGRCLRDNAWDGVLFSSCILFALTPALYFSYMLGQWSLPILAALLLMLRCLETKRDVLAGVCWAVVMVKPQFGVLLMIPLVFAGRWKAIATAVATCVLLTIPSALISKTSPVTLIMNVKDLGVPFFRGNGFVPCHLLNRIAGSFETFDIVVAVMTFGMALGVALCAWVCWWLRNETWKLRIAAVSVCSLAWSYSGSYDYVLLAIPMAVIFAHAIVTGRLRTPAFVIAVTTFMCPFVVKQQTWDEILKLIASWPDFVRNVLVVFPIVLLPLCWIITLVTLFNVSKQRQIREENTDAGQRQYA